MTSQAGCEALERHGLTGTSLLRLSYSIANGYARRTGSGLDSRIDDLAQWLALTGTRLAITYDPAKSRPGYSFTSYLHDVLQRRCVDWHRQKAEGFGDRRYGHDNRIQLTDFTTDPLATITIMQTTTSTNTPDHRAWVTAATILTRPFNEWPAVNERRAITWIHAAETTDLTFEEWVARALDLAAAVLLKDAA